MSAAGDPRKQAHVANRRLLQRLAVIAIGMFGFGFLLVPFYEQICKVTGLRNIDRADTVTNTQVVTDRTIRLELDSNVRHLAWVTSITWIASLHTMQAPPASLSCGFGTKPRAV